MSYAFRYQKSNIKEKGRTDEYIYDLENTFLINIEILDTMLDGFISNDQKKRVSNYINRIKDNFSKLKKFKNDKFKISGKYLMDQQILEELRRSKEENQIYYQEQIDEFKENIEKKSSFVKQFEKKFLEVEIFVQRESKLNIDTYEKYINFEVVPFIHENEFLLKRKMRVIDELNSLKLELAQLVKENLELKTREEYVEVVVDDEDKRPKYSTLIDLYNSKINFVEWKNIQLKNVIKNLNDKMEYMKLNNDDMNDKIKNTVLFTESNSYNRNDEVFNNVSPVKKRCYTNNNFMNLEYVEENSKDEDIGNDSNIDISYEENVSEVINHPNEIWNISCINEN